jgi:hypothetical protein
MRRECYKILGSLRFDRFFRTAEAVENLKGRLIIRLIFRKEDDIKLDCILSFDFHQTQQYTN